MTTVIRNRKGSIPHHRRGKASRRKSRPAKAVTRKGDKRGRIKHRGNFFTTQRDALREAAYGLGLTARAVLEALRAEADIDTHEIRGSERWLAPHIGVTRDTLARQLKVLRDADLIEVRIGPRGSDETVIVVTCYDRLGGIIVEPADDGANTGAGGLGGGTETGPLPGASGLVSGLTGGLETLPAHTERPAALAPKELQELQEVKEHQENHFKTDAQLASPSSPQRGSETLAPDREEQKRTEEQERDGKGPRTFADFFDNPDHIRQPKTILTVPNAGDAEPPT